ncbi:hypothetical protein MNBD_GAMMA04-1273 [hydrothermal vent metagenome]|uniref:F5/8 type C domain-containing protein n=1 Tax=hydrothermal vent metagenome TaxID=652676 RepID=A0A3B0WBI5_9ZZZZ
MILFFGMTTGVVGSVQATPVSAVSATGTGSFNNSPELLIDGVFAPEFSQWSADTSVWWSGMSPAFSIDLGGIVLLEDLLVQVDNNDFYRFDYSEDNNTWSSLFEIQASDGEVSWGMDTMSTDSQNSEYVASLNFVPVDVRYLRVVAIGGDNLYSVSEIQAFAAPVPEPSTILLFGLGLMTLMGFNYRRQKQS